MMATPWTAVRIGKADTARVSSEENVFHIRAPANQSLLNTRLNPTRKLKEKGPEYANPSK